ncbi:MAG: LysR substrate-binding domain-containing protein [Pseudomonadota bacterium]
MPSRTMPDVLRSFRESHPRVSLEVTCDLTLNLLDRFAAGEFDLVLIKREPQGPGGGLRVWREPLVWAAIDHTILREDEQVPLVVSPHPCVYRKRATTALDRAGLRWRIAYTSTSLAGAQAAVRAGLGISILPREMVPHGFIALDDKDALPALDDMEVALMSAPGTTAPPVARLSEHIVRSLERAH